jgi:hypothetical protein
MLKSTKNQSEEIRYKEHYPLTDEVTVLNPCFKEGFAFKGKLSKEDAVKVLNNITSSVLKRTETLQDEEYPFCFYAGIDRKYIHI